MNRRCWIAACGATLALLGAGAQGAALQACRLRGVEFPARCGVVQVPLDPAAASGLKIDLHFAVLPALSRSPKADPVFFFAGGPGQSAIDLAGPLSRLLARWSNRRDIVLIDQRGTGRSAPLRCDGDAAATQPLRESLDTQTALQALARCRQTLMKLPYGDLRRFTTTLAANDVDAVRRALGAERINLIAASYGTRLALEVLRQHPLSVRRMLLDGVAPPDMVLPQSYGEDGQAALDALFDACAGDAACSARHPRLRQTWQRLQQSLPRELALPQPLTGRSETLTLTPDGLAALVRGPLYSPVQASALPLAIEQAAVGQWQTLAGLALSGPGTARSAAVAQGMHFSVVCAEDLPLMPAVMPAALPATSLGDGGLAALYRRACADWPRGDVAPGFYRVPVSPVPVLLLAGGIDPVTPPRHAQRVARALGPLARTVVVPQGGHGLLSVPCLRELGFRFIDADEPGAALALDTGCAQTLPRPPFFTPPAAEVAR